MTTQYLDDIMELSKSRAETYLHIAKSMVINQFGPAAEHTHNEVTVAIAAAMMQHEGAQIMAEALRAAQS